MNTNKYIAIGGAAAVITILCGLVAVSVQQNYRSSLNDPQIEIAESISTDLAAGAPPEQILSQGQTDLTKTLSPFVAIYDNQGKVVISSALYKNVPPVPPSGTFDAARKSGENRFSWQPEKNVREAVVLRYYSNDKNSGFVLAARSMREVENREKNLYILALIAWAASLIILAGTAIACGLSCKHRAHTTNVEQSAEHTVS